MVRTTCDLDESSLTGTKYGEADTADMGAGRVEDDEDDEEEEDVRGKETCCCC